MCRNHESACLLTPYAFFLFGWLLCFCIDPSHVWIPCLGLTSLPNVQGGDSNHVDKIIIDVI